MTMVPKSLIFSELEDTFPDKLVILQTGNKHVIYHANLSGEQIEGLACFSSEARAKSFADGWCTDLIATCKEVTKDEAVEIASQKAKINCLLLCDNPIDPKMYFFR